MRVHLIKKQSIEDFMLDNALSRNSLQSWLSAIKYADWDVPSDIRKTFRSADLLGRGSSRVVFNISGNAYRMVCKYFFGERMVHLFVCWIGSHAEYDLMCSRNVQYFINRY